MARSPWPVLARQFTPDATDAELLASFTASRDEDAFARLVSRYGRLVWGVCRNGLPNEADAEDAFQATFLVLARSAKSIRAGAPLGPWLHGVAFRVSQNARRAAARRVKHEGAGARPEGERPVAPATWEAAFAAVAEEVQHLPEGQRAAFVLCALEGRSETDAAAALGQKVGTVSSRLARAKQSLLARLEKRGFGVGAAALGALAGGTSDAPAALVRRTLSLLDAGAVSAPIHALTQGVTTMGLTRLKVLLACTILTAGAAFGAAGWLGGTEQQPAPVAQAGTQGGAPKAETNPQKVANAERMDALAYPGATLRRGDLYSDMAQRTYFATDDLPKVEEWYRKKLHLPENVPSGMGTLTWPPGAGPLARPYWHYIVNRDDVRELKSKDMANVRELTTLNFVTRTPEGTTVVFLNRAPADKFTMITITFLPPEAK